MGSSIITGLITTPASPLYTVQVTQINPVNIQDFYGGGASAVNILIVEEYPT